MLDGSLRTFISPCLTEQLTKEKVIAFMKTFLEHSHFCEVLMEPEDEQVEDFREISK